MSNLLITMAYKRRLGSPMRKAVMALLADKASDDGTGVWASKQTMADELDCSRQAIINTIAGFIADGLLVEVGQRASPNGFTVEYAIVVAALDALPKVKSHAETRKAGGRVNDVDGSTALTGQFGGRVNDVDPTRQRGGHEPSLNPSPPDKADALSTPAGGSAAGDQAGEGKRKPSSGKRQPAAKPKDRKRPVGARIAADWQPPALADLSLPVQAIVKQWPSGAYELTGLQFRNHWLSEGRAIGAKRDWPKTWENWLMRESTAILRAAKAGQRFDAVAKPPVATPADDAATQAVMALQAKESDRMAPVRAAVRASIGPASYDGWVKGTAFRYADGVLRVVAPSAFKASWIEQHFRSQIAAALEAAGGKDVVLRFEEVRPSQAAKREPVAA